MRAAVVLVMASAFALGACRGADDGAGSTTGAPTSEPTSEPTTGSSAEQIVIRTRVIVAAEEGAEPIATGEVVEGSTLGASPFCAGGTILDSHADPAASYLIDRTIACPDGTVRVGFTPEVSPGLTQTGSWRIVGGTGAYDGLGGNGDMEIVNDPDDPSVTRETLTGTATR
jgi:hypothetical protein